MVSRLTAALLGLTLTVTLPVQGAEIERLKIAVLDLKATGVDAALAANLTSLVVDEISRIGLFEVISRQEIAQMLSFEEERQQLGCNDASCLAEIGGALGVAYLVTGAVGQVGGVFLLNLQLMDIRQAKVDKRAKRDADAAADLVKAAGAAARELVGGILAAKPGVLLLRTREEGANVHIDGSLRGVTPLGTLDLPAGPHEVRVSKTGFVDWAKTIELAPQTSETVEVVLIPSQEFIAEYEDRNRALRTWAWVTTAAAVALGGAALGLFLYADQAYFPDEVDKHQKDCKAQGTACPQDLRDKVESNGNTYDNMIYATYGLDAGFVLAATAAVVCWILGDDPDRYEEFRSAPASFNVAPGAGGGTVSATIRF